MIIIIKAVNILFNILEYALLARVLISWFPISPGNPVIRLLYQITEPFLAPIRNMIQRSALGKNMMMDFSPILAYLLLGFLQRIIISLLVGSVGV